MPDTSREEFYGESDPRDLPVYSPVQAASYLDLPESTVRRWTRGYWSGSDPDRKRLPPVLHPPTDATTLSFTNLVELHVLAALRRTHRVPMPRIREAIDYVEEELGVAHPLARHEFETDGLDLFVDYLGHTITASQIGPKQVVIREALESSLERIERDEAGLAARFYPFSSGRTGGERIIVIDPEIAFGRPVIRGTGASIDVIAERFHAGEELQELASDYNVSVDQVGHALRLTKRLAA